MFNYAGRTALVTGAGKGMGLGIAKTLAKNGAKVFVNDISADLSDIASKSIGQNGFSAPGDLTNPNDLQAIFDQIGSIDILCNNAGVPDGMLASLRQADALTDEDYEKYMALNFTAIRKLCGFFVPGMRKRKHGRVLIISSESHRIGLPMGLSHYAAAKSAALGYMRSLAAEVGRDNVTVNALSLGTMNNFAGHEHSIAGTLVGRAGTPEDVGAAALYLCSDEAGWMTGQTISLNGGSCTA